jgi:phenylacetate-CoA ligase
MLFPHQVELFQSVFGVPLLNLYGGRELSVLAFQPTLGTALQILRPWVFAEIVDDDGAPAGPGETGRLLWTSTICRGTPFLRYEIGDLGVAADEHDRGAGWTHLSQLQGRTCELLRLPNGKVIQTLYWNHFFKDVPEVRQFQVIVNRDKLQLLLVGSGLTPPRHAEVLRILKDFLGDVPIELSWVSRIPLTSQGKLLQVVHRPGPSAAG